MHKNVNSNHHLKVKDYTVHPRTGHEDPEGNRGITLFFI